MATGHLTSLLLLWALASPPPNDVVPMNSRNFKIPISIKSAERSKIKEVTLFYSEDEGKTWSSKAVLTPDKDSFVFFAPKDGLYWFAIAVIDTDGKQSPADIYKVKPNLKVLVDTQKPSVRIVNAERHGDDVVVSWEIQEEHPDLSTLKLEYHTADGPAWAWYKVDNLPRSLMGQTHFRFVSPGSVVVKVEMLDQAGNLGGAQTEIAAKPAVVATGGAGDGPPPGGQSLTVPAPPSNPSPAGPFAASQPVNSQNAYTPKPAFDLPPTQTPPPYMPPADSRRMADQAWVPAQSQTSTVQQTGVYIPETSSRYAPATNVGSPAPQPVSNRWPGMPLPPVQITNSPELTLNYEVTDFGPSGVGSVELYITRDDGMTWTRFADDPDCKSPMMVNLPGEGTYGLRLVVGSRAGLGRKAPQSGDVPQMRVQVDTTPPVVKLLYPEADPHRKDVLILAWNASDPNAASNPVTLLWAARPNSQWTPIAAELPNTGRYTWQLTPELPDKVYLRITVRDAAGNIGVDDLPRPVLVDLHEPQGQILSIASGKGR